MQSLLPEERETIISWNDADDKIFIYSSQQRIKTKLKRNPQFEQTNAENNPEYVRNPVSVSGFLPLNALTLRRTSKKGQKPKTSIETQVFKDKGKVRQNEQSI